LRKFRFPILLMRSTGSIPVVASASTAVKSHLGTEIIERAKKPAELRNRKYGRTARSGLACGGPAHHLNGAGELKSC
jgi:hypothetical protein